MTWYRWTFTDVATDETFTMVRNPRAMDSPLRAYHSDGQPTASGSAMRVLRPPGNAAAWTFSGRCHSEAEQDDLRAWAARDQLLIRDHHNRGHLVVPQGLSVTPVPARSNGTRNPWLYEYTFKSLYLRRMP